MEIQNHKFPFSAELLIILCALVVGIYYEWPTLVNPYVIDGDVRTHIDWMRQFQDPDLFPNDLLATYARNRQPWGIVSLYYFISFLVDPVLFSKILPLILLAIGSYYAFKLGQDKSGTGTGFLAAILFMVNPTFLGEMTAGLGRSFGYPLMIAFLYYLIKKDGLKAAFVMILACLFYPIIYFLCFFAYLFSFLKIRGRHLRLDLQASKSKGFVLGAVIGIVILGTQHLVLTHPVMGPLLTKEQMLNQPEFYEKGRVRFLPTPPLARVVIEMAPKGVINERVEKDNPVIFFRLSSVVQAVFWTAVGGALFVCLRKTLFYPSEFLALFFAGVLMYRLADVFLLKLYLPERYFRYSLHVLSFLFFAFFIGYLLRKIKTPRIRKTLYAYVAGVIVFLNLGAKTDWAFVDQSPYQALYTYLNRLPKDTMIAAHPKLADGIPLFARRKVLIKYELASPIYSNFWREVKKRTYAFFDAYYAENVSSIDQFCERNGIDYLVVDKNHFTEKYINKKRIYFEPFNTYTKNKIGERRIFALMQIPEKEKLFTDGSIFVIHKKSLKI